MAAKRPPAEHALADLQRLMRRSAPREPVPIGTTRQVPEALAGTDITYLTLLPDERDALRTAERALAQDLRFEHMADHLEQDVWLFACQCYLRRDADAVTAFVTEYARDPETLPCYVAVEYLKVSTETNIFGIHLLPIRDQRIPGRRPWFALEPPVASVAVVDVTGTDLSRMAERARGRVRLALRRLRVALREHRAINDRQLRFRLGEAYSFGDRQSGRESRPDTAYELGIDESLVSLAETSPIAKLPPQASTDVDRKCDLALEWMERAWFATEPLIALLYLFYALEALLGDQSEGLKAHALAFRQATLSHVITGGFTHPDKTYFLYDRVRSGAVHGEDAPDVSWSVVHGFATTVRWTVNHYIRFARDNGYIKRGRILRALNEHPDREQLVRWLRANGHSEWEEYFSRGKTPS